MNVLVIGSGGREHALAWKLAQSEQVEMVYVAPGNAGTALENKVQNIDIKTDQFEDLCNFSKKNHVELTIVGPEVPLVKGIVDYFSQNDLLCFGPTAAAAQLEGSKIFTKDFLARHNIPSAEYQSFTDQQLAIDYVRQKGAPIVIKADGLAAGKGVIVATSLNEAEEAITSMLEGNQFGEAGHRVVIEEFLDGEEASFIVITDGENIIPMATSQDHKRIGEGDTGPNTGGMGAYSPAPVVTAEIEKQIIEKIIQPTVKGMAAEGNRYTGFLYAGLMINKNGEAKVIEYNCRFGDPETQPIMMRLDSDLASLCLAALTGSLKDQQVQWSSQASMGVVLAAEGYPGDYKKGLKIEGLESLNSDPDCKAFHAGTTTDSTKGVAAKDNAIITSGGRVLCITALGDTIEAAQKKAYQAVDKIKWSGIQYRKDIGYRAIFDPLTQK